MPVLMMLMALALIGLPQALAGTGDLSPFNAKYHTSGTGLTLATFVILQELS